MATAWAYKRVFRLETCGRSSARPLVHPDPRLLPQGCLPVLACARLVQLHTRLCLHTP